MITCPSCGKQNRPDAKFCRYCGADFSPERAMSSAARDGSRPSQPEESAVLKLAHKVKRLVAGPESVSGSRPAQSTPPAPPQPIERPSGRRSTAPLPPPRAASRPPRRPTPLQRGRLLSHPRDPRQRYAIVTARELEHSIYYDALDLTCPACRAQQEKLPPDGTCRHCQAPLEVVLIHEQGLPPDSHHPEAEIGQLVRLSAHHPNVVPHRDIVQYQERTYTVVDHPGRWGVLVRGRRQRSADEALAGVVQVGRALSYLHESGFVYARIKDTDVESLIVTGGGTEVKLADLALSASLPPDDVETGQAWINRDVVFLSNLLFYLATGETLQRSDVGLAPSGLRPFVERGVQGAYASVEDMLADFSLLPSTSARSLKPSHGQATHPGQHHPRNEDAVVTFTFDKEQDGESVPIGFYLVADGMGGHDAGDIASRTVNQIVTDWIISTKVLPNLRKTTRKLTTEDVPGDLLTEAIRKANRVLSRHSRAKDSDPGSTVTAALVIGDVATIANVGDSRTYLLRDGRLEQITQDHSLVARLVNAGVIESHEVRSHPQRNKIYRCLGHEPSVEVDTFTRQLRAGDALILCSDGLWEMVLDGDVRRIVEAARSPQQACDELITAANRAGGEDNIAVIVVEME